jgi:site-specific recombinase XerD
MLNYTVRPVLWDYKDNPAKIYTIKICITIKGRSPFYLLTPHKVNTDQWRDGKVVGHTNAKRINDDLAARQIAAGNKLMECGRLGIDPTKAYIEGSPAAAPRTFKGFAKDVDNYEMGIRWFTNFVGEGFLLASITPSVLRQFEKNERDRGVTDNSIGQQMKFVSKILKQAKLEKLISENPFDAYSPPKFVQPVRLWLDEDEKGRIFEWLDKPAGQDPNKRITAVYFLLECYTGFRHVDWKSFDPATMVAGGFIRLRAQKNDADVVMPIGPTLAKVIDMVRQVGPPWSLRCTLDHLKVIFEDCGIKKKGGTHLGRHSFGYLCASNGLPKSVTAKLMGISVQTVEVYYHLTGENIIKQAAIMQSI